ncbi:hypothetical protein MCC01975_14410 [Bifidobacteriaceae bacterium MCC01975]|nr:hypothetical protein MCC01975_14410 [Bifidobacteriaceae bacterium MCC01975]
MPSTKPVWNVKYTQNCGLDHASYVPTKQKPAIAKRHNATMNLMHRVYRFASGPYGAAGVLAGRDDYGRCDRPHSADEYDDTEPGNIESDDTEPGNIESDDTRIRRALPARLCPDYT